MAENAGGKREKTFRADDLPGKTRQQVLASKGLALETHEHLARYREELRTPAFRNPSWLRG